MDNKLGNADLVIQLNKMRDLGLNLEIATCWSIDTSQSGYRIKKESGRYLSPFLKTVNQVINSLELMYNAIQEYQELIKKGDR